jgi:hypothetical protein
MSEQINKESSIDGVNIAPTIEATRDALLGALSAGRGAGNELLAHLQAICDLVTEEENASAAYELQDVGPNSHEIGVFSYIPPSFWSESNDPATRRAAWDAEERAIDNS